MNPLIFRVSVSFDRSSKESERMFETAVALEYALKISLKLFSTRTRVSKSDLVYYGVNGTGY